MQLKSYKSELSGKEFYILTITRYFGKFDPGETRNGVYLNKEDMMEYLEYEHDIYPGSSKEDVVSGSYEDLIDGGDELLIDLHGGDWDDPTGIGFFVSIENYDGFVQEQIKKAESAVEKMNRQLGL